MAYDEDLADRIRELIAAEADVTEQRMFGGLAFLVGGNMAVAASGQGGLMVRVDPEGDEAWRDGPHVRPFEMRGRRDAGLAAGRRRRGRHEARARALGPPRRRARAQPAAQGLSAAGAAPRRPHRPRRRVSGGAGAGAAGDAAGARNPGPRSGVTLRASISSPQWSQVRRGSAISPQSSWRRTIGGPSGPARCASPQRMSATIAGKRSRPGVGEPVLVAVGVPGVGDALEQARVDERPQPGGERRPRDVEVAGELPEAAHAEERLAQDQQRPALADQAERPARRTRLRSGARGRRRRPWFDQPYRFSR